MKIHPAQEGEELGGGIKLMTLETHGWVKFRLLFMGCNWSTWGVWGGGWGGVGERGGRWWV